MNLPADSHASPRASAFPQTQWSMIARADGEVSAEAHSALEHLCRRYWFPLYAFIRRQGRSHHEAEDAVQAFLARLLAADGVSRARRARGRFRTFLLTALRNFLTTEWHRAQTEKRGGGQTPVSFEIGDADERFSHEPVDPTLTPDQVFDRSWAQGVIERAVREIRADYEKSGRGALFAVLMPLVWGDGNEGTFAAPAAQLGLTTPAFHRRASSTAPTHRPAAARRHHRDRRH